MNTDTHTHTDTNTGPNINPNTSKLQDLGQSLWVDNISREMLTEGTLARYIADLSVTGLTSNPTIFEHAIGHGSYYDKAISRLARVNESTEELFFSLALEDLITAADLFRPIFDTTAGLDGWVSLEVSPLLADDTEKTIRAAARLHDAANKPNLFIKIPGTQAGVQAIEESIFGGVNVNVTLLFSCEQYVAAADAYMRGIERRLAEGLDARVTSVASLFVSRWDVAVKQEVSPQFHNRLGIAIAMQTYKAYRDLLASPRWLKLAKAGARPQRLLWASTGTKDPEAPDTLYVEALAAPDTINTIPEKTLQAFADHGKVRAVLPTDGGYCEAVLEEFRREGVDDADLAARLQREGAEAFTVSWRALLSSIREKRQNLAEAG
jgi:transaldolase